MAKIGNLLQIRIFASAMIKAIVFDMGGVLFDLDVDRCIRTFRERAGFQEIDRFIDPWHQRGFISDMEEGLISGEEFLDECVKRSRPGTSREIARACFLSLITGIEPYKAALLRELAGRYDLYLLTNNNPIAIDYCEGLLAELGAPVPETFRGTFYSYRMHLQKPSRAIYERVIAEIGVRPEEILFIDDSQANLDPAAALGIRTAWYEPHGDLRATVTAALGG